MTDRPVKFQARYPGTVSTPPGPPGAHTHAEADVTGLVADLTGKAATSHTHAASDVTSGTMASARLGSGTANSTTFLRGDSTWQTVAGGDVVGPASAVNNSLAAFDTTTGKLIKDAGLAISAVATLTGTQALTNKDLTSGTNTFPSSLALDSAVVKLAGSQTITGSKTLDLPVVQTYQGSTPATPAAGHATGPYFGADGLPYYLTPTGVVVPLTIGDAGSALHSNPSFENWTASNPDNWHKGWIVGAPVVAQETTDVLFGSSSLTVTHPASTNQVLLSSVFTVAGGDTVNVGVWGRKVSGAGSPQIQVGLLTGPSGTPSGTPDFFDGYSTLQQSDFETLGATFARTSKGFSVPSGHIYARMVVRTDSNGASASVARLDFTTSSRTGAGTSVLPGNSWPKEAARLLTTATFTPTTGAPNSVDGATPAVGDRMLKATPAGHATDGLWQVVTVGSGSNGVWARCADATTAAQLAGAEVAITAGTTYGGTRWGTSFKSTDSIGSTAMVWTKILTDSTTVALTGALTVASTSTFSGDVTLSGSGTDISVGGHATVTGTGWVDLTLAAGFGDLSAFGWRKPQYRREGNKVWLRGLVNRTGALTAANITMLTLPAGAQLNGGSTTGANDQIFLMRANVGYSEVDVMDTAAVKNVAAMATNDWTSLDGIFFTTD